MRALRFVFIGLALSLGVMSSAGCSSDEKSPVSTSSSVPPESVTTAAASVAQGLTQIDALALQIKTTATSGDSAQAKSLAEGIEALWAPIEGTVKGNDEAAYLTFEDNFALLETGEAAKSTTGADAVSAAVKAYLAKFAG